MASSRSEIYNSFPDATTPEARSRPVTFRRGDYIIIDRKQPGDGTTGRRRGQSTLSAPDRAVYDTIRFSPAPGTSRRPEIGREGVRSATVRPSVD